MIEILQDTEALASDYVRSRADECDVQQLSVDKYTVKPQPKEKQLRLVSFSLRRNRLFATCEGYDTGEACDANRFKSLCCHVLAALELADKLANEPQRSKAA